MRDRIWILLLLILLFDLAFTSLIAYYSASQLLISQVDIRLSNAAKLILSESSYYSHAIRLETNSIPNDVIIHIWVNEDGSLVPGYSNVADNIEISLGLDGISPPESIYSYQNTDSSNFRVLTVPLTAFQAPFEYLQVAIRLENLSQHFYSIIGLLAIIKIVFLAIIFVVVKLLPQKFSASNNK